MGVNFGTTGVGPTPVATQIRTFRRTRVETADAWPTGETGWIQQPLIEAVTAEEGFGTAVGSAELMQTLGVIKQPDRARIEYFTKPGNDDQSGRVGTLCGKFVRLSLEIPDPETGKIDAQPFWWGIITHESTTLIAKNNKQTHHGECRWQALGLGSLLHRTIPAFARELNDAGEVTTYGEPLVFNDIDKGDRSQAEHDGVYVHDRSGAGTRWTAQQVAEHLLKHATLGTIGWELTGQTSALAYSDRWDLRGLSVWDALNTLIGGRMGLGFRVEVPTSGSVKPRIAVSTLADQAISIEALTIPANNRIFDLNVLNNLWIGDDLRLDEDHTNVYDDIRIVGKNPWSMMSFLFNEDNPEDAAYGDLQRAWTQAEEDEWDGATDEEREQPKLAHVWRRWRLVEGWEGVPRLAIDEGAPASAAGIRMYREPQLNQTEPIGWEETGVLTHIFSGSDPSSNGKPPIPARAALRPTRSLPMYEGYNYDEQIAGGSLPDAVARSAPFVGPLVFIARSGGDTWEDISDRYQVTVLGNEFLIELGRNASEAAEIHDLLIDDGRMVVTLGIEDVLPLRTRWERLDQLYSKNRVRSVDIPTGHEQWYCYAKTALRVEDGELKLSPATGVMLRDEVPRMKEVLQLAKLWYAEPTRKAQWTVVGEVEKSAAMAPGAYLRHIISGRGNHPVGALVTARRWDLTEAGFGTTYMTDRVLPALGAVR